jgi:hypothetical protein
MPGRLFRLRHAARATRQPATGLTKPLYINGLAAPSSPRLPLSEPPGQLVVSLGQLGKGLAAPGPRR